MVCVEGLWQFQWLPTPFSLPSLSIDRTMSSSQDNYYKTLPDYAEIAPYLEEDPPGFEPAINIAPFQLGCVFPTIASDLTLAPLRFLHNHCHR
jgi:hypothetical protein